MPSARETDKTVAPEKAIKSDSTTDRDANGQQAGGGEEQRREPMSDEQFEKALAHLRGLPVVKDHNLEVDVQNQNEKRFILLKEPTGKVVRRIPEAELWSLLRVKPNEKGQILRKSA